MYINEVLKEKNINKKLVEYITTHILPMYDKNNIGGHDQKHIEAVILRSFELADKFKLNVDLNMVYTIAAYHDIGYKKNPDEHEQVSSDMFLADSQIAEFFTEEQIAIIADAIVDHRASLEYEARSIYGKLVSSADREVSVENMLERSIKYQTTKHQLENPTPEEIIEYSYKKLLSKYGKEGYAKMYYQDDKYLEYLTAMQALLDDKELFIAEEKKIMKRLEIESKLNPNLVEYIKTNVFPSYAKNDSGHDLNHIKYVIERSFYFASQVKDINNDMVYTIAAYHDIGHYIDANNHEKVSAEMLLADDNLKQFFSAEEMKIMSEAVNEHRASLEYEPHSIYGKIVSSADRNVLIDAPLRRTYAYRINKRPNAPFEEILEESRLHLIDKFGKQGYAKEKMYFEDEDYKTFLEGITALAEDKEAFRTRYMQVNNIKLKNDNEDILKTVFEELKQIHSDFSLDELLYEVYIKVRNNEEESFDDYKESILRANNIDEFEYYTKNVNPKLKEYVYQTIFPQYEINDKAHGIVHILEVIRRSFALKETYKLELNDNMIFAIAACHDLGKHENHEIHEKIAAKRFIEDEKMLEFFTDEERTLIHDAIEDHRSSKEDEPRSTYGKLISSADRNTSINIVFIRSFFVAKERTPEETIENYLDYTIKRLSKKYSEENPENMFYEDKTYKTFIADMRNLLKNEEEFKKKYCEVNHITSRSNKVGDEQGEVIYIKALIKR